MPENIEAMLLSDVTLSFLDQRALELHNFAAERTNQMVMMFVLDLVTRHAVIEIALLG